MTTQRNTVLYTEIRGEQHKNKIDVNSFTARYNIEKLVYLEIYYKPLDAIEREKQIKKYRREQKIKLIESINPEWKDLLKET